MENAVSHRHHANSDKSTLVVYYGPAALRYLETLLGDQGLQVRYVAGREADAVALIQQHPAKLVVLDGASPDISINQATRQIGRLLPNSLVFKVQRWSKAAVFMGGHQVGQVENPCISHFATTFEESNL